MKPFRYQTTSSDEAPLQKRRCAASTSGSIHDDIEDIRRTLEDNPSDNNNTHITQTQSFGNTSHLQTNQTAHYYTQQNTQTHTYTPNIQTHTYTPPIQAHTYTHTSTPSQHFIVNAEDGQVFYTNKTFSQLQQPLQDRGYQDELNGQAAISQRRQQNTLHDDTEKRYASYYMYAN